MQARLARGGEAEPPLGPSKHEQHCNRRLISTKHRKYHTNKAPDAGEEEEDGNANKNEETTVWVISPGGKISSKPKDIGGASGQSPEPVMIKSESKEQAGAEVKKSPTQGQQRETMTGTTTTSTDEEQRAKRGDKQRQQRRRKASEKQPDAPRATQWRTFGMLGNLHVVDVGGGAQELQKQAEEEKAGEQEGHEQAACEIENQRDEARSRHEAEKRQRDNVRRRKATRRKQLLTKTKRRMAELRTMAVFKAWKATWQEQQLRMKMIRTKMAERRVKPAFQAWRKFRAPIKPGTAVMLKGITMPNFRGLNGCYATVEQQRPYTDRFMVRVRSGLFQGRTCTVVRHRLAQGRVGVQQAWAAGQSRWEHARETGRHDQHTVRTPQPRIVILSTAW